MPQGEYARTDWREKFFDFGDTIFLNAAGQAPIPRVSARALEKASEWKRLPHTIPDDLYFALPDRVRGLLATLLGAEPHEFALTTGATGGLAAVAHGLDWKPEDEVLVAAGEFPAHLSTWKPMAGAGRLTVKMVRPRDRFITAGDFIAAVTPRTRLVSASLVRFDDASLLDARRVADAVHAAGGYLLLDVSQAAAAVPFRPRDLGADFLVCAGYKWLLSPFGSGFFWIREELIDQMRPGPFYWMAIDGSQQFHALGGELPIAPEPKRARRWDTAETASFFNLAVMEASLTFVLEAGVETVRQHNERLTEQIIARLPLDRCVLASPRDPAERGPYVCVTGRSPEKTKLMYDRLRESKIYVALREGNLRIAPYLYNTEQEIDRVLMLLGV